VSKRAHWPSISFAVALLLGLSSCTPVPRCGNFTFNGTKVDTAGSNGIDMDVSFDFNPAGCGSSCTCNPVAYVQIVRTVDMQDFTYIYPSEEKQDRATEDGWYIDRLAGKKWGYYGRNDDGSFAGTLTPGSETTNAILRDSPRRPEAEPWLDIWWQAVSVPVCIQAGSGCENKLLGFYFWSWFVDPGGAVADPIHAIAWRPLENSVDAAVAEWNTQAPGLGKFTFPAFTRLVP
jgi:hypothetical protein